MARFIPAVEPEDVEHASERQVLIALRTLGDDYVILHSYPWLRPNRDLESEPLREGEADFVVLHPRRGMLTLEVKGGEPELRGRLWVRGRKQMRDPFEQARRSRYALLDAVEERTNRRVNRSMFTHGDAVVFPHSAYEGQLPLNTDPRVFIDARGLVDIASRIEAAYDAWERAPRPMDAESFRRLQDALLPKLSLVRWVGAGLEDERVRICRLTEAQQATLLGLLASDRVLVEGVAGSGKTLLALDFAVTLATSGLSVLMLCYNKHLSAWLKTQADLETRLRHGPGLLHVRHFHSLALQLAGRARVEVEPPSDWDAQFWEHEVPMILEQALDLLDDPPPPYDAVVVDEGQDFAPDWWVTVESLLQQGAEGRLYVFLDLKQSLRGECKLPPLDLGARFALGANLRSTRTIAEAGGRIGEVDVRLMPGSPAGVVPTVRRVRRTTTAKGLVLREVRDLLRGGFKPRQIALIGPARWERGTLQGLREISDVPLTSDAASWRLGESLLVTTARAFKGLEADVIVLYDIGELGKSFSRTDLYVAWTRARHRIIVVAMPGLARELVLDALGVLERNSVRSV